MLDENLWRRTLSLTSFLKVICFNFKTLVNKTFHWKGGVVGNIVSKPSFMLSLFKSLLLETQTTTKQQFDPPAAMNHGFWLISVIAERENVNSDHSWVSFFFDNYFVYGGILIVFWREMTLIWEGRNMIRVEKLASSLMSPEAICFSGRLSVNCLLIVLHIS